MNIQVDLFKVRNCTCSVCTEAKNYTLIPPMKSPFLPKNYKLVKIEESTKTPCKAFYYEVK